MDEEVRKALVQCDSIMSLIRYRNTICLSEQDVADLDAAISTVRALTGPR